MNGNNMNFPQMMFNFNNMNFNQNMPWNPMFAIMNQNNMFNQMKNNMNPGGNSNSDKNVKNINLVFKHKNTQKITLLETTFEESFASVVNSYIKLSGDCNINKYLLNGKKINESLSISRTGIKNYDTIVVSPLTEDELNNL